MGLTEHTFTIGKPAGEPCRQLSHPPTEWTLTAFCFDGVPCCGKCFARLLLETNLRLVSGTAEPVAATTDLEVRWE